MRNDRYSSSTEAKICRYCHEEVDEENKDYVNPCTCITPVHIECINQWLAARNRTVCEICHHDFAFKTDKNWEWGRCWKDCTGICSSNSLKKMVKHTLICVSSVIINFLLTAGYTWKEYFTGTYKLHGTTAFFVVVCYYFISPVLFTIGLYAINIERMERNTRTKVNMAYIGIVIIVIVVSHSIGICVLDNFKVFKPRDETYAIGLGMLSVIFIVLSCLILSINACYNKLTTYRMVNRTIIDLEQN